MYRLALFSLLLVTIFLQYRIWFGVDSLNSVEALRNIVNEQQTENLELENRNQELSIKVTSLKAYPESIEEHARYELGMIKSNETYYQVVEPLE